MRLGTLFFAWTVFAGDKPVVSDLSWIAGHWSGQLGSMAIHETWTPPHQGNMTGTFRMMRDGKVSMYELIVLEDRPTGPVMLLRHYDAAIMPREQKPHEFALVGLATVDGLRRAEFREDEGSGVITTLVYRQTADGLAVDFDKTGAKPQKVTFAFRHAQ